MPLHSGEKFSRQPSRVGSELGIMGRLAIRFGDVLCHERGSVHGLSGDPSCVPGGVAADATSYPNATDSPDNGEDGHDDGGDPLLVHARLPENVDVAPVAQDDELVTDLDDVEPALLDFIEEVLEPAAESVRVGDVPPNRAALFHDPGFEDLVNPRVLRHASPPLNVECDLAVI
jgi:hypothetical protein